MQEKGKVRQEPDSHKHYEPGVDTDSGDGSGRTGGEGEGSEEVGAGGGRNQNFWYPFLNQHFLESSYPTYRGGDWIQWSAAPSSGQLSELQIRHRFALGKGLCIYLYLPFL